MELAASWGRLRELKTVKPGVNRSETFMLGENISLVLVKDMEFLEKRECILN